MIGIWDCFWGLASANAQVIATWAQSFILAGIAWIAIERGSDHVTRLIDQQDKRDKQLREQQRPLITLHGLTFWADPIRAGTFEVTYQLHNTGLSPALGCISIPEVELVPERAGPITALSRAQEHEAAQTSHNGRLAGMMLMGRRGANIAAVSYGEQSVQEVSFEWPPKLNRVQVTLHITVIYYAAGINRPLEYCVTYRYTASKEEITGSQSFIYESST